MKKCKRYLTVFFVAMITVTIFLPFSATSVSAKTNLNEAMSLPNKNIEIDKKYWSDERIDQLADILQKSDFFCQVESTHRFNQKGISEKLTNIDVIIKIQ